MALVHPSLTLILDLDERLATKDTILEIKRCYSYIGTPLIRQHAPEDSEAPLHNVARVLVGMGQRKYLYSCDEGADDWWYGSVEKWIGAMLHKIGTNMKQFNYRQRKIGFPEIVFDCFDIELQGGEFIVSLHPDLLGYVGSELQAAVGMARTLLNDGTFAGATRVRIPADFSYEQQREAALPLWEAEHPEPEEPEETSDDEEEAAEEKKYSTPTDKFYDEEWLSADAEAKSYENTAVPITDSEELPSVEREEEPEPPEPFHFDVNYAIWSVHFADGSYKIYDSENFTFIEA